jgi:hypothetical protein
MVVVAVVAAVVIVMVVLVAVVVDSRSRSAQIVRAQPNLSKPFVFLTLQLTIRLPFCFSPLQLCYCDIVIMA